MKIPHKFESFDGTRIAYRVWGQETTNTPLVFFSGIACDDVYWFQLAPTLSQHRLVITWDYPWHGDSGPPGDKREITIGSLARHCHEIVSREGIENLVVAGHSMGVQVALEYIRFYPEEVKGFVSIAGGFAKTVGYLYGTTIGEAILSVLQTSARLQPDITALMWRTLMNPSLADPIGRAGGLIGHAPAEVMERYFQHLRSMDVQGLFAMFREGHNHSAADVLPTIDVPALILHGTADVMTPISLAKRMAEIIPVAELIAIPSGGHTLPAEDPEMIASKLEEFLEILAHQKTR